MYSLSAKNNGVAKLHRATLNRVTVKRWQFRGSPQLLPIVSKLSSMLLGNFSYWRLALR